MQELLYFAGRIADARFQSGIAAMQDNKTKCKLTAELNTTQNCKDDD